MAKKQSTSGKKISSRPGITPLADRVLVRPLTDQEGETKSAAGIIIPDSAKGEKTHHGEVVAVGPGKRDERGELIAVNVAPGDRIIFSQYGYDEIEMDGETYYLVSESNILATLN